MRKGVAEIALFLWGIVVWVGFVVCNVGPCNNRAIPTERSAPIIAIALTYLALSVSIGLNRKLSLLHFVIWSCAAFSGIMELPFLAGAPTDWYSYAMICALLAAACAPSVAIFVLQRSRFGASPTGRRIVILSAAGYCGAVVIWVLSPVLGLIG